MVLLLCLLLVVAWLVGWAWFNISGAFSLALLVASVGALALEAARRRRKAGIGHEVTGSGSHAKYRIVGLGMVLHDDPPRRRR